eukprot:1416014-Amphidinium_carterae.1
MQPSTTPGQNPYLGGRAEKILRQRSSKLKYAPSQTVPKWPRKQLQYKRGFKGLRDGSLRELTAANPCYSQLSVRVTPRWHPRDPSSVAKLTATPNTRAALTKLL